ncbi:MAG: N-acetylmuramate/N-acetylglucosamine kinase [Wenzhouxiangellaceae bacterium]
MTKPNDPRYRAALDWAIRCTGWNRARLEPASTDASFRRYFRLQQDGHDSLIVMDAPPGREPLAPFLDIGARLLEAGLHAPQVLDVDESAGFVLLEDLGCSPYHRVLDEHNADQLFTDALDALVRMQTACRTDGLGAYDAARLRTELDLFVDWFLGRHWRVEPTVAELQDWDALCDCLILTMTGQPQVFCHRDFMPRNLMYCEPNPGIIDFQDALLGPLAYDAVCLFRDAFLSWPPARVEGWLEDYRRRALEAGLPVPGDPGAWRRLCDLTGVQRHLKVLGIFARIRYRDGKPAYLEDAPRFFAYLAQARRNYPETAVLGGLLESWRGRARTEATGV